jgi:hypothetical protein
MHIGCGDDLKRSRAGNVSPSDHRGLRQRVFYRPVLMPILCFAGAFAEEVVRAHTAVTKTLLDKLKVKLN